MSLTRMTSSHISIASGCVMSYALVIPTNITSSVLSKHLNGAVVQPTVQLMLF